MAGPAVPARRVHDRVDLARLARLFHALSDETRLKIVGKLLLGEQCVCNLMDTLDAGQSRLSFHMKTLKDAGLVTDRRAGRWIHYSLNPRTSSGRFRRMPPGSTPRGVARRRRRRWGSFTAFRCSKYQVFLIHWRTPWRKRASRTWSRRDTERPPDGPRSEASRAAPRHAAAGRKTRLLRISILFRKPQASRPRRFRPRSA